MGGVGVGECVGEGIGESWLTSCVSGLISSWSCCCITGPNTGSVWILQKKIQVIFRWRAAFHPTSSSQKIT